MLSDRRLVYSEMVGSESLGAINIEEIEAIEEVPAKGSDYGFAIHTAKRTYWCVSNTEDDRKVNSVFIWKKVRSFNMAHPGSNGFSLCEKRGQLSQSLLMRVANPTLWCIDGSYY